MDTDNIRIDTDKHEIRQSKEQNTNTQRRSRVSDVCIVDVPGKKGVS